MNSRKIPQVAYLAPPGTYSEAVAKKNMPDAGLNPMPDITSIFEAVESGAYDYGIVPHENSVRGNVIDTLDSLAMFADRIQIVDAERLQIKHVLAALSDHGLIDEIYSKSIALEQCSAFLHSNYKGANKRPANSTAAAMKMIADEVMRGAAAVGSEEAAKRYGLEVIARDISNIEPNFTRFLRITKKNGGSEPTGNDITSIVIHPLVDQEGYLSDWSKIITSHDLNMSNMELLRDKNGGLMFYVDIQGHIKDQNVKECIRQLESDLSETEILNLGSYRYLPVIESLIKTVGVIGGTGIMGMQFFKPFHEAMGQRYLAAGRRTELSYEEVIRLSDAIVFNLDLDVTRDKIRELCPLIEPGKLVVCNTGVKSEIIPLYMEYLHPEVELLPLHTMFGGIGGKENLKGENIIVIETNRFGRRAQEYLNSLKKYRPSIKTVTPEQHDAYVTLTQNLPSVISAALEATIREVATHPNELEAFSTPPFRLMQASSGRTHSNDPALYAKMLDHNPYAQRTLEIFMENFGSIVQGSRDHDRTPLQDMLTKNQFHLGGEYLARQKQKSIDMDKAGKQSTIPENNGNV
ncbi:prephenate dehydrogenase/arogenate dehydrogenase family protein [Candidatus Woesearchaeota archaeon]|nr:prephenate dehydrogenase/arogenate dehydrogenase family protein [Candidatus Woesearchaeota archaeon]